MTTTSAAAALPRPSPPKLPILHLPCSTPRSCFFPTSIADDGSMRVSCGKQQLIGLARAAPSRGWA
jgi:hypothetical protein